MGDGTANTALKGSPTGGRQSAPLPRDPSSSPRRGNAAAVWQHARPNAPVPAFAVVSRAAREGQVWVSSVVPVFLQRRLSDSFGK